MAASGRPDKKNNLKQLKPTMLFEIYWEFCLFPRFSKFEVQARKSILNVNG